MAQQALIVYYSQFNNTTKLAKLIQDATKAAIQNVEQHRKRIIIVYVIRKNIVFLS